jgi:UPF0755 protein
VIEGLPPGPIANPGRASLEATANPARTRDLFFVADGTGGHTFSETYDQHQKSVARLRSLERQQQNDTLEPVDEPAPAAGAPTAAAPAVAPGAAAADQATGAAGETPKPAPAKKRAAAPAKRAVNTKGGAGSAAPAAPAETAPAETVE